MTRRNVINPSDARLFFAVVALPMLLLACNTSPRLSEPDVWSTRQAQLLALSEWQLQGRINARYKEDSHTPRIRWRQIDDDYTIRLWGTLNVGATLIQGRPGHVLFEHDGESRTAGSPEEIVLEELGYELPVSSLNYWVKGLPIPDEESQIVLGEFNQLVSLQQSGWTMYYEDYRVFDSYSLPRRIEMSREEDNIQLVFFGLNWTFDASTN